MPESLRIKRKAREKLNLRDPNVSTVSYARNQDSFNTVATFPISNQKSNGKNSDLIFLTIEAFY